jgi:hypothetical protein
MQLKYVVDPFGEVNVYPERAGKVRVTATILMEPHREGTQTGIAIDGSGSMANLFGVRAGGALSPIFLKRDPLQNVVSPVAQALCAHLARHLDADGGTTCIYWATGQGGSQVEVVADFTAEQAEKHVFGPPRLFGAGTQLLPAVKYFVQRFADAPWGFYVFITDGELHDLEAVKTYTRQLAQEISAGKRRPLKFVLIGVGPDVNEKQMEILDDLDTGTDIDLWDHKLASEMRAVQQIFAEVVDKNARVAEKGKILDPDGRVVKDYSDTGVTGFLEFEIASNAAYFTLEVPGHRIHQALREDAIIPEAERTESAPTQSVERVSATHTAPETARPAPQAAVPTARPAAPKPVESKPVEKKSDEEEEWLGFDLKFENQPDVDLGKGS